MTNAIEQAKREMYELQAEMLNDPYIDGIREKCYRLSDKKFRRFESAFESYLEQVRQDHEALHETARKRFEDVQVLEAEIQKWKTLADNRGEHINHVTGQLAAMTEDRDGCQSRMQAIDHAYNEQQKKTGTCGQVCGDRGASEQPDAKTMAILGVVVDCQQLVSDWAVYGYRAKKQMKKMAYVLNNNPELRAALDHFEGRS